MNIGALHACQLCVERPLRRDETLGRQTEDDPARRENRPVPGERSSHLGKASGAFVHRQRFRPASNCLPTTVGSSTTSRRAPVRAFAQGLAGDELAVSASTINLECRLAATLRELARHARQLLVD